MEKKEETLDKTITVNIKIINNANMCLFIIKLLYPSLQGFIRFSKNEAEPNPESSKTEIFQIKSLK
jgi:hypothetical protein